TVRYQQNHQGIPVMGGELIVNTNANGDLYSMNGEVSSDLSLSTEPTIDSEQARQTALQAAAKWYQKTPADFVVSEPELWIYDESLLRSSTRPVELVWRMEVASVENSLPVRELVLVNAQRGNISLHFNQIDTAWTDLTAHVRSQEIMSSSLNPALQAGNWPIYFEMVLDESRGWIYGSDSDGNKVDVISMTTLQLVKSFTLVNGASPKGIALSPSGSELAIAQFGASSILFLNPNNGQTIATLTPDVDSFFPNVPWDVIYGRSGRLYSSGNPGSGGIDYIHVINTNTHVEIAKSSHIVRAAPSLAISSDNNWLYASQVIFSPQKLYKYDVSTDTIPEPTSTGHTSGFTLDTYLLLKNGSKIFTSTGQVWSNPTDLSASTQLGTFNASGHLVEIQSENLVGVLGDPGEIKFVNTTDYSITSTISIPTISAVGPGVVNTNESKLFFSTNDGIKVLNLDPSVPAKISIISGTDQSTPPQSQFSQSLKVTVQNYLQQPLVGLTVTFTAPAGGASGTFANTLTNVSTAVTDANGIATASAFSANSIFGNYIVKATVSGLADSADFQLSNGVQVDTYSANNSASLPGIFLCNQSDPNCVAGDAHAKAAHKYAIGTYNFYATQHGRDSIDNNGMTIISTVHYYIGYSNSFWDGSRMVYGDAAGWPLADDVVAHEFTHGVTQNESNLFYYYQSGAINESF
ncbi:MAG TPA: hypothetical protein VN843_20650, partial [Anaerolineales bacterium]|nr:hypothetical protein [Anaerolineales bacterium]